MHFNLPSFEAAGIIDVSLSPTLDKINYKVCCSSWHIMADLLVDSTPFPAL